MDACETTQRNYNGYVGKIHQTITQHDLKHVLKDMRNELEHL